MRKEDKNLKQNLSLKLGVDIDLIFGDLSIIFDESKSEFIADIQVLKKHQNLIVHLIHSLSTTKTQFYDYCKTAEIPVTQKTIKTIFEILMKYGILNVEQVNTGLKPAEIYYFPKSKPSRNIMVGMLEFFQKKFKLFKEKVQVRRSKKTKKDPKEIEENSYNAIKATKQAAAKLKMEENQQSNEEKKLNSDKIALRKRLRNHSCKKKCNNGCVLKTRIKEIDQKLEMLVL